MDRFQNKYLIPSARLQNWDYGSNGAYFITICTKNRECYFGEIMNNVPEPSTNERTMQLSEIGKLAEQFWLEIPNHFSFIELGNFVVMPNHVHGILIIDKMETPATTATTATTAVEARLIAPLRTPQRTPLRTPQPSQTPNAGGFAGNKNPMINENISRIIRWYKGRCSFEIRKIHTDFSWQSRFHDHIIRNSGEFERIQNYIANNTLNWKDDKFHA